MALPLPRKYYTSHCAATRREYPDCSGRGFGACGRCRVSDPWFFRPVLVPCELHRHIGDPTPSRTENRGVADHCLTNLAMGSDGTQRRSRTYVKGLEDPCTIHYTNRAYWRRREVSIPIPSLVPLVFKTRLRAGAIPPPYIHYPTHHLLMSCPNSYVMGSELNLSDIYWS